MAYLNIPAWIGVALLAWVAVAPANAVSSYAVMPQASAVQQMEDVTIKTADFVDAIRNNRGGIRKT